jgi:DNA polymerase III delta prime subunit
MAAFNYYQSKDSNVIVQKSIGDFKSTYTTLEPGIYKPCNAGSMFEFIMGFTPVEQKDELIKFKDGVVSKILRKADLFFGEEMRKAYAELKINHKMGIIMYGPHGTGKSCTAMLIMQEVVKHHNAICLDCSGMGLGLIKKAISTIRNFQTNPIVVFSDEFDEAIEEEESEYLTFLDGTESVDHMIMLGCTNKIDAIPDRIKLRKSRVKYLYEIKTLPMAVYLEYIADRLPNLSEADLNKFAYEAIDKELTLDELKHAVIDYRIDGISIDEAIADAKTQLGK